MSIINRTSRRVAFGVGVLTISALIAGCANSSPAAQGDQVIELWELINPDGDDPRGNDLRANIDAFEKANPGVKVEVTVLPWANIDGQLMQAANAGNSPDVVRVLAWDVPKHIAAGNLLPLEDLIPAAEQEDWLLGWDTLSADGHKWAIPFEYRSPVLYYRTDYTGAEPPATWDEMVTQASGADSNGGVVLGMSSGAQAAALAEVFVSYLWAEGAEVFDDDGKAAFDSPEGIRAFERIGSLMPEGVTPEEAVSYTYEEVFQSISAGTADFWLLGSHRFEAAAAGAGLEDTLRIAPLPGLTAGQATPAHVFGWSLAIGKDADDPDLAAKLISHMTSADSQLARVQNTGELPTRASVYEDPWFTTEDGATAAMLADWFQRDGRSLDYGEHYIALSQLWAEALQRMALEGLDAATAAKQAADAYNALL